jgi:hypothetical protein
MITLTCPACAARIKAPDRAAGRLVPCPRCDKPFRVSITPPLSPSVVWAAVVNAPDPPAVSVLRHRKPIATALIVASILAAGLSTSAVLIYQQHRRDADFTLLAKTKGMASSNRKIVQYIQELRSIKYVQSELLTSAKREQERAKSKAIQDAYDRIEGTLVYIADYLEILEVNLAACRRFWEAPNETDRRVHSLMAKSDEELRNLELQTSGTR